MLKANSFVNAMTVDVEDYFQVSAFDNHITRAQWVDTPCRVENSMARVLALFDKHNVKATFFTLGWLAERYPHMIRDIVAQGHELASHGWDHRRVTSLSYDSFKADVSRTKALLEDISGQSVIGYRAPSYSIGNRNLWALDVLADTGHRYSSSIVPVKHDHYGMPEASRFPFKAANDRLLEVPVTTLPVLNKNVNFGGGGWFRFFPYAVSKWALEQVNQEGYACNFYFHPWEIDAEQPRLSGLPLKTRFRHYINLHRMHDRLDRLLGDFEWGRMDEIFLPEQSVKR